MISPMSSTQLPVRVRFAPSPTGELHLGSARTALYNSLFARHTGGELILRIEDTDRARSVPGSSDRFLTDFAWLGITFDRGPIIQSKSAPRHREVARELVARHAAYYDFSSQAGVGERAEAEYRAGRSAYRSPDRSLDPIEAQRRFDAGEPAVIRLKVPDRGTVAIDDLVRGRVEFDVTTIDDAVLIKSDGFGTYHLAATVDDHDMGITHVLRSEEWLSSTPKHLLIYRAMGWPPPQFAHVSLILASDGTKLSKRRHGATVWVKTYRDRGYLPEALVNSLALIGWNPGDDREFFTLDELVAEFSIERLNRAGGKFDEAKLDAFQQRAVRSLSDRDLTAQVVTYLAERQLPVPAESMLGRLIHVLHDRLSRFDEFAALAAWASGPVEYPAERLIFKKSSSAVTQHGLTAALAALSAIDPTAWESVERLTQSLATVVASESLVNGDVFWPVRVALTGLDQSPSPAECLWVLGRSASLERLARASQTLTKAAG
jgi:glutamyl-tRNA synthetase